MYWISHFDLSKHPLRLHVVIVYMVLLIRKWCRKVKYESVLSLHVVIAYMVLLIRKRCRKVKYESVP